MPDFSAYLSKVKDEVHEHISDNLATEIEKLREENRLLKAEIERMEANLDYRLKDEAENLREANKMLGDVANIQAEENKELRMENARLKAEIDLLKAEREWRPIETAPRDSTSVLTGNEYGVCINSCRRGIVLKGLPTGWDWTLINGCYPTHWCPLPDAPEEKP